MPSSFSIDPFFRMIFRAPARPNHYRLKNGNYRRLGFDLRIDQMLCAARGATLRWKVLSISGTLSEHRKELGRFKGSRSSGNGFFRFLRRTFREISRVCHKIAERRVGKAAAFCTQENFLGFIPLVVCGRSLPPRLKHLLRVTPKRTNHPRCLYEQYSLDL
jgi:hypothetical protein